MEIKNLGGLGFSEITKCFNESFADYIVPYNVTDEYLSRRFQGGRADYRLSYGAFENNELVGFIIHGIDNMDALKTAFNIGTGVIPEYRGNRIVQKLYDYAVPALKQEGIKQCKLEVICSNEKAVKAYKRVGFEIVRSLQCVSGEITRSIDTSNDMEFKRAKSIDWKCYDELALFEYSWENCRNALKIVKDDYEVWELHEESNTVGYVFINPKTGYIPQFGVEKSQMSKYIPELFSNISRIAATVKINNIESTETVLLNLLLSLGLKKTISQYEMGMKI